MLFDAHLHAVALRSRDLEDLRFFGITGALAPSDDSAAEASADAIRKAWEVLSGPVLRRMRRAGLAAYAALGVHPRRIPRRGLEALLAELPDFLGRPRVVAIGAVGLEEGGPREEEVFARQLALARQLRLPVLVRTPWKDRERLTRRTLSLLRDSDVEPAKVLVDHADARTVRMIRECGYHVGLSLSTAVGWGRGGPVEEAARIVASLGPERLVLDSDAGGGPSDLLALPRAAHRLSRAGLSEAVIRRVCGGNAAALLGVEGAVGAPRAGRRTAAHDRAP